MGPTTRLAVETNPKVIGLDWNDETLTLVTDSLSNEFHLPASAPGGFIAYRKCLVTSLFFKFFITVQSKLSEKNLMENCDQDDSAIGKKIF